MKWIGWIEYQDGRKHYVFGFLRGGCYRFTTKKEEAKHLTAPQACRFYETDWETYNKGVAVIERVS